MTRSELAESIRALVEAAGMGELLEVHTSWPTASTIDEAKHLSRHHWRIEVVPRPETDPRCSAKRSHTP